MAGQENRNNQSDSAIARGLDAVRNRDFDLAIAEFSEAVRLGPDYADAYLGRGSCYYQKGDYDRVIDDLCEVIRLKPDDAKSYHGRGVAYDRKGDYEKALADYSETIRLKPDYVFVYGDIAWLLATCPDANFRDGATAVEYAKKACELMRYVNPFWFGRLAAAYAEAGDFDNAVKWQTEYLKYQHNPLFDTPEKARQRLSLYEQKKPYHEEKP
jgi:tetratricopeptide (TPR) repeat protein